MAFTLLASLMDATTYPNPNTLTTKTPLDVQGKPHSAWASQGKKALVPLIEPQLELRPIDIAIKPSGGGAVTWTLGVYTWVEPAGDWFAPHADLVATISGTGNVHYRFEPQSDAPVFLAVNTISTGSLSVYYQQQRARAV